MIEWNAWKEIKEYLKGRLKLEVDSTSSFMWGGPSITVKLLLDEEVISEQTIYGNDYT